MPRPGEQLVIDTIKDRFSGVWHVSFEYDEGLRVTLSAVPQSSLCFVSLSRLVADMCSSTNYTIRVDYGWSSCRLDTLFGPVS